MAVIVRPIAGDGSGANRTVAIAASV